MNLITFIDNFNNKLIEFENSNINLESINVVVEEEKLEFDTFKDNYAKFATIRKLVELIKVQVERETQ